MSIIDTSGYVSEFTKKTLEQFGWVPGDPLLEQTGEIIQQIRERTPPTKKAGLLIDIDLMSEKDVELMRAVLTASKEQAAKEKAKNEFESNVSSLAPGVQDAYRLLAAAQPTTTPATEENKVQIVDDRATSVAPPAPEPTPVAPVVEENQKTIPPPDLSPEAGVAQPITAAINPAFCPRCDWDLRRDYDVKITDSDKENFLATILGGTRYKKSYSVLNGKYTVVFRTLLAEENRQIHRQLVLEQKANEFFSDTEWFLKFFEYRLACSIESIIVEDKVLALLPPSEEVEGQPLPAKLDDPSLPTLIRLHNYVIKELLGAEVTRRLVSKQFREFQREYEALEAMALEPNFW